MEGLLHSGLVLWGRLGVRLVLLAVLLLYGVAVVDGLGQFGLHTGQFGVAGRRLVLLDNVALLLQLMRLQCNRRVQQTDKHQRNVNSS